MFIFRKKQTVILKWPLYLVIIFLILAVIILTAYFIFGKIYEHKIYPGVYIGNIDLGGRTAEQAKNILNQRVNRINQDGIIFSYENHQTVLLPLVASIESDLAYEIINFDTEKTVNRIFGWGRHNNFYGNFQQRMITLFYNRNFTADYTINKQEIKKILADNFSDLATPAQDAKLIHTSSKFKTYFNFSVQEEKFGKIIAYESALKTLQNNLEKLKDARIQLTSKIDYPKIYKKDCLNIDAKAKQILGLAPLILINDQNKWTIKKTDLADWLSLKTNQDLINEFSSVATTTKNKKSEQDKIAVSLNPEIVKQFLNKTIAPEINRDPLEGKLEIKDGRVVEFQISRDGQKLDANAGFKKIVYELIHNKNSRIELIIKELKSALRTEDINDLGIKEIIGIGESNFTGSPKNRRHNIKIGADALNGLLIKPGEEFSLNNALGEIDGEAGYLPELVIRDNKTIPEYGGGLCQIGTTMFRAALATGLPITMRRNHSYRVSYYEPAGTDATIYSPWPDMKFINDTEDHILIQARIEGDNIYFDFWGADDGRQIEKTEPTIYNIVRPGPTKIIETLDLAPEEKKCTEHAHNGADAYFDYKVIYADGEIKEKKFSSHYVPWREVCLLGVEKLSTKKENKKTATSTTETAE